jgi:hypothetical protein
LYHDQESKIPYDYEDIIGLIAPRNCLIYSPVKDRFTDIIDIKKCIASVQNNWEDGLSFITPDDICRFQREQHEVLIDWLKKL